MRGPSDGRLTRSVSSARQALEPLILELATGDQVRQAEGDLGQASKSARWTAGMEYALQQPLSPEFRASSCSGGGPSSKDRPVM